MFKLVVKRGGQVSRRRIRTSPPSGGKEQRRRRGPQSVEADPHRGGRPPARSAAAEPRQRSTLAAPPAGAARRPRISTDDYVGDVADRTGFGGLEAIDEITMVCVPDLMSAYQQGAIDLETVQAVQLAMIAHCELMGDRMAILDPPPGLNAQQIKEWRVDKAGYDSKYAALYWPWIKVVRPGDRHATASCRRAGTWPASGAATTTPAACTRRRRTRSSAARSRSRRRSPRTSTTCSTRSASTASGRSPAAASGCGAPARCPPTRHGAT